MKLVIDCADAPSTRVWCENALHILKALGENPDKVPFGLPPESRFLLETIVLDWLRNAELGRTPQIGDYETDEFKQLIVYWFNITKLTPEERDRLGITFTPPEGRAFADALAAGVAEALFSSEELTDFARRLEESWRDCQAAFVASHVTA